MPILLVLILQRNKPKTPPSVSAGSDRLGFKKSMKLLWNNRNFHLINAYYFIINSVFNVFLVNIDLITEKYDAFD